MANNGTKDSDYVVGLDIGTSKVVCIIGKYVDQHSLEVVSMGSYPSSGLKKGVVVNIDATTDAIQKSIDQAQASFEGKIKNVYVGIAGNHIRSLNSHGIVGIKDKEVEASDIDRVIEAAQAVAIPSDQRVLHVLPQEYVIDNQDSIREPLGMSGVRLESHVHLVTCANNAIQNIEKCVKRCGIGVDGFVLEQLASSYSVLSEDEKELGVCLVDIGGGTTEIAILSLNGVVFSDSVRIGGDRFDEAIVAFVRRKYGCVIGDSTAERVKIEVGTAFLAEEVREIDVRGRNLAEGVPRAFTLSSDEILEALQEPLSGVVSGVKRVLEQSPPELASDIADSGIVLTGGGSLLRDMDRLLNNETGLPIILAEDPLTCVARGGGQAMELMSGHRLASLTQEV